MSFIIKPYNVIDHEDLKEISVDSKPVIGAPLEVDSKMYFICAAHEQDYSSFCVKVIPFVYKNGIEFNTESYLESLSVALRRMQEIRIVLNQY